jgi:uncharacterized YccA/Bax inhibitor family protein
MSTPVFNNSPVFGDTRSPKIREKRRQAQATDPSWGSPTPPAGAWGTADAAQLESMYQAPSATNVQMRRMTYDDVIVRTGGLLALVVAVAAVTWNTDLKQFWFGAMLVGVALALVNSFKRNPSPALIILYAVAEGVFLGGISYVVQNYMIAGQDAQPVVFQAIIATLGTFAAALLLFRSGKIRVTPKFTRWFIIALVGYGVFSLTNFVMSFFMASDGFGPLRDGPMGAIAGLIGVALASLMLIMDFDAIKRGVEGGVPQKYAWAASFGLLVTLIWLYIEFLRLLAMLTRN